jgi:hypothetical protein
MAVTGFTPQAVQGCPVPQSTVLGIFVCSDPVGALAGTVIFNGTTTLATDINGVGIEFGPGIGKVPEYTLTPPPIFTPTVFGPGALTFELDITDTVDETTAVAFGAVDVAPMPLNLIDTTMSPRVTTGNPLVGIELASFSASSTAKASDFSGTLDWGDGSPLSAALIDSTAAGTSAVFGYHTLLRLPELIRFATKNRSVMTRARGPKP